MGGLKFRVIRGHQIWYWIKRVLLVEVCNMLSAILVNMVQPLMAYIHIYTLITRWKSVGSRFCLYSLMSWHLWFNKGTVFALKDVDVLSCVLISQSKFPFMLFIAQYRRKSGSVGILALYKSCKTGIESVIMYSRLSLSVVKRQTLDLFNGQIIIFAFALLVRLMEEWHAASRHSLELILQTASFNRHNKVNDT